MHLPPASRQEVQCEPEALHTLPHTYTHISQELCRCLHKNPTLICGFVWAHVAHLHRKTTTKTLLRMLHTCLFVLVSLFLVKSKEKQGFYSTAAATLGAQTHKVLQDSKVWPHTWIAQWALIVHPDQHSVAPAMCKFNSRSTADRRSIWKEA